MIMEILGGSVSYVDSPRRCCFLGRSLGGIDFVLRHRGVYETVPCRGMDIFGCGEQIQGSQDQ